MGARKRKIRHSGPTSPRGIESFPYTLPDGSRALYIGDAVRESDPPAVREGIVQTIPHAHDCPAAEENLISALRGAR